MAEIVLGEHVRQRMAQRGATEAEVRAAIEQGESEPARKNRMMYRKNFPFDGEWRGRSYRVKQVTPVVVEDAGKIVVVTVYVFYF